MKFNSIAWKIGQSEFKFLTNQQSPRVFLNFVITCEISFLGSEIIQGSVKNFYWGLVISRYFLYFV